MIFRVEELERQEAERQKGTEEKSKPLQNGNKTPEAVKESTPSPQKRESRSEKVRTN